MIATETGEPTLILYTTSGCHLCEEAAAMLKYLQSQMPFQLEPVDIATDEALVESYGIRIPVVKLKSSEAEIGWPFSLEDLTALLPGQGSNLS